MNRDLQKDMNSKKYPIRPIGQRSITSTFLFRASNRSSDCQKNVEPKKPSEKGSGISLSDYLNRKLHSSSVLPSSVSDKEQPVSSPLSGRHWNRGTEGQTVKKEGGESETKFSIDGAFNMFKNVDKGKNNCRNSCSTNEIEILDVDDLQQTRKRKDLFEGRDDKLPAPKRLVVLGEDSKPKQSSRMKNVGKEEPRPLFNHYENGGGWWDDNMEGIDNEEVGFNDVWEGVGSTTLGGIEWH